MNRLQDFSSKRAVLIALLVAATAAGCGSTTREQPSAAASVAALPAAAPSIAQQAPAKPMATHPQTSAAASTKQITAKVLSRIHQADLTEIALAQMAEEKASSDEVRAYAVQLIEDHTNVDQSVKAMASKTDVNLRNGSARHQTADEKQLERKMKSANGADFDKMFLKETRTDHQRLISKLQQAREDASDDDLEALIDKVVPILQQDQQLADTLTRKEKA